MIFNDEFLRTRRDHKKYLNLIKVIAFLKQYQKEQKVIDINGKEVSYIEVELEDISFANYLSKFIFSHTLEELSPPSRNLFEDIKKMVKNSINGNGKKPEDIVFTRKDIRNFTKWSNYQIKAHIKELHELEYLIPISGGSRKKFHY